MKSILITAICVISALAAKAQSTDPVKSKGEGTVDQENFTSVEIMPEFPGGNDMFLTFIAKTVRYPAKCYLAGIEGKVYVQIMIEADGSVTNPTIIKSASKDLDDEAIRTVLQSPRWKPAIQNGQPVRFPLIVPIKFNVIRR